ncbi:PREDICTED: uncharacterized protein LOC108764348 [Trachymyrmex cornetzi]|uniref:uncharacterized protein LOC108764348 n=1 Tax=Trachymyrmex cornetzi TaxID=471704 RepID=UPI00084EF81D|nr:PREDICTED: uncharacterized protein LOC108764348 [Trachymyrmex cornetzi]
MTEVFSTSRIKVISFSSTDGPKSDSKVNSSGKPAVTLTILSLILYGDPMSTKATVGEWEGWEDWMIWRDWKDWEVSEDCDEDVSSIEATADELPDEFPIKFCSFFFRRKQLSRVCPFVRQ